MKKLLLVAVMLSCGLLQAKPAKYTYKKDTKNMYAKMTQKQRAVYTNLMTLVFYPGTLQKTLKNKDFPANAKNNIKKALQVAYNIIPQKSFDPTVMTLDKTIAYLNNLPKNIPGTKAEQADYKKRDMNIKGLRMMQQSFAKMLQDRYMGMINRSNTNNNNFLNLSGPQGGARLPRR